MKPFNIDAAKRGEKVVTRNGRAVRILTFDAKGVAPIIALVDTGSIESPQTYHTDGTWIGSCGKATNDDLFMQDNITNVYDRDMLDNLDKMRLVRLPFNLEAATFGAILVTRDGRYARLLKSDCKGDLPLVVLVEDNGDELACNYNINGRIYDDETEDRNSNCDLYVVGLKNEGNY